MTTEEKLLTAEEYYCLHGGDDDWTELVDGKVVQLVPPGADHNDVLAELFGRLWQHVKERRLGRVLPGDTGIVLLRGPDTVRGPDICFYAAGRLPAGRLPVGLLDVPPELAVEIISPSNRAGEIRRKTNDYLAAGVRLVWNIYPDTRSVVVIEPPNVERTYHADDMLTGAPVLPDFRVRVGDLFAE